MSLGTKCRRQCDLLRVSPRSPTTLAQLMLIFKQEKLNNGVRLRHYIAKYEGHNDYQSVYQCTAHPSRHVRLTPLTASLRLL